MSFAKKSLEKAQKLKAPSKGVRVAKALNGLLGIGLGGGRLGSWSSALKAPNPKALNASASKLIAHDLHRLSDVGLVHFYRSLYLFFHSFLFVFMYLCTILLFETFSIYVCIYYYYHYFLLLLLLFLFFVGVLVFGGTSYTRDDRNMSCIRGHFLYCKTQPYGRS